MTASRLGEDLVERGDRLRLLDLRDHVRVRAARPRSACAAPRTSDAERTNESATKSTPSSSANSRSSRSLRVSDGIGSGTPGRLTPLCERDDAADDAPSQRARPALDRLDAEPDVPVVDQHVVPGLQHGAEHGGADRQVVVLRGVLAGDHDRRRRARARSAASRSPTRSFGPCRSAISAIGRPAAASASRTSRARSRVVLVRAVREVEARAVHAGRDQRARASPASTDAGPIVATIFVRRVARSRRQR